MTQKDHLELTYKDLDEHAKTVAELAEQAGKLTGFRLDVASASAVFLLLNENEVNSKDVAYVARKARSALERAEENA